ncbi:MAG TPA: FhaA domain-containing protein [Candidatus Limnocylindrales bacterium]|jgi:hypothetical protein
MARVERFIERLVERPTARVFGTQLQPVQILRRIEREMEAGRRRRGERTLAPDRFDVLLSPDDLAGLGGLDAVAEQLASGALAFARSRGLTLSQRPRVELGAEARFARGDIEVAAGFSAQAAGAAGDSDVGAGTRVFEAPIVHAPAAALEVAEPGRSARTVDLSGRPSLIGRGSDCDVVLADAHASRHHARLEVRGGVFVLTDLGSTNGTRVNGHRVREVVLGVGDRIEVGQSTLRVVQPESPQAAA